MNAIEKEWVKYQQKYKAAFKRHITQKEFAEVINCDKGRFNRIIKGSEKPSQPMAKAIKKHTHISLDILLGE